MEAFLAAAQRFLSTPEYSRRIGIMLEGSRSSGGRHSLQSWTGCTVAATVSEVSPGGFIQPAWWWLADSGKH